MTGRSFALSLCMAFLAACATPAPGPAAGGGNAAAPPGRALIYFYRPKTFAGSANVFAVDVNGVEVGQLTSGGTHTFAVTPGPVNVEARILPNALNIGAAYLIMAANKPSLDLDTTEGEVRFIKVDTSTLTGGPTLTAVSTATGKAEVARLDSGEASKRLVLSLPPWQAKTRASTASGTLVSGGITDARADISRIGRREAALGVSMGSVFLDQPVPEYVEAMVLTELRAAGYRIATEGDGPLLKITLDRFWFDTETSALYWDVNGSVALSLSLTDEGGARAETFTCSATDRTYSWPGREIFEGVATECLTALAADVARSGLWHAKLAALSR